MKKSFNAPTASIMAVEAQQILAASVGFDTAQGNGNGGPTTADSRQQSPTVTPNSPTDISTIQLN